MIHNPHNKRFQSSYCASYPGPSPLPPPSKIYGDVKLGTGQTNTLTLCNLLGKTYKPAHSSATLESLKSTLSTKLQEKLLTVSSTHIPLKTLTGLVRSLNSDVKAFKTANSM